MLIIVTIVIEINIIMLHITSLPQWAITQCDELGGDAIIGLKGKFEWMITGMIKKINSPQIFEMV